MKNNSDELGVMGEAHFARICAQGKLIANSADRDRAGWDYVVEHPILHDDSISLDKRTNPISSLFQVKSLLENTKTIKFRVSSLERIAKERKPSFLYIAKFNNDGEIVSTHIIHFRGAIVEKILKKLRELQSQNRTATNKEKMNITYSQFADEISPTGSALRSYIEAAVGADIERYIQDKSEEIKTMGYSGESHKIAFSFKTNDKNELIDVLFGDKDIIPIKSSIHETRFNIELESPLGHNLAKIRFNPIPSDTCRLYIRATRHTPEAVIDCRVYTPPKNFNIMAFKISSPLITIQYQNNEFKITSGSRQSSSYMNLRDWIDYFIIMLSMMTEGSTFKLFPRTLNIKPITLIKRKDDINQITTSREEIEYILTLMDRLRSIFNCIHEELPIVSIDLIGHQAQQILNAYACICTPNDKPTYLFTLTDDSKSFNAQDIVAQVIFSITLNDSILVWYLDAEMSISDNDNPHYYEVSKFNIGECRLISTSNYQNYLDSIFACNKQDFVIIQDIWESNSKNLAFTVMSPHSPDDERLFVTG